MTQVSGTNEQFLKKEFAVPKVFEIMEPFLSFIDFVEKVPADARSVAFKKEVTSASTDTKKKAPRKKTASAKWTYLDITPMEVDHAILGKSGFAIRIDEDAIDFVEGVDEIKRAYRKVAFWMAEAVNANIGTAYTGGATTPDWTPAKVWSDPAATPIEDLRKLKHQMRREGYPYRPSDYFVHTDNLAELEGYLTGIDIGDTKQKDIYGMPKINSDDTIEVPIVGTIHGLMSGIEEGSILAIDKRNPAGTMYYNNNSKYGTADVRYRTSDGKYKTVPNFGLNFNRYEDPETHDQIMQFWMDQATVIKEPYAALFDSGI